MEGLKRINKYISDSGFCSRREADALIEKGKVLVNGKIPLIGTKIDSGDSVIVNGQLINTDSEAVYLAFNKPILVTCTTDSRDADNIIDYIGYPDRIFPIGRLDKMSEGLIFLTNDGDIVNKVLRAENNNEKEYLVRVDSPVTEEFVRKMSNGVPILDTTTKKCEVSRIGKFEFRIVLTQGLNRQIRRMCEELGYKVKSLKRVRIMDITLGSLGVGKWRALTPLEVEGLVKRA
ncbi:MAG: 23S rRNA pseudouridine2604 synthase [Patescibacteria group bacterium]|jgi:23S rRNA pseudouridine2604 synthase